MYLRFVFLGQGARIITIGNPVDPSRALNDNWLYTSFFEITRYFVSADFKFIKYQVESSNPAEFELSQLSDEVWRNRYYDANVRVDLQRMEGLVRQALWENHAEREWRMSSEQRQSVCRHAQPLT